MNTSLKNKLLIDPFTFFRDYSKGPSYLKKGIWVGAEEEGPRPSSDRDGRIYLLAVPVPK